MGMILTIFAVVWFSHLGYDKCNNHLEDKYEGIATLIVRSDVIVKFKPK